MPPSGRYGSRDRLRLDATSLPVAPRGASRSLWCAVRFSAGTVANAAAWAVLAVLIAVAFVTVNLLGPAGLVILGLFVLFVCAAVPIRGIGRAERRRSRHRQQGKGRYPRPPASNAREYPPTRAPGSFRDVQRRDRGPHFRSVVVANWSRHPGRVAGLRFELGCSLGRLMSDRFPKAAGPWHQGR